ncbi:MAG: hypothetical protein K8R40_11470 [Anaerolineaceae bacterium]|nr:hypothetical protein [Anaerolineaceae bacterium]
MNWVTGSNLAILGIIGASLILLLTENWRLYLVALAIQYLAVFWLISFEWNFGLAAVKLVVGLMAAAILGASHPETDLSYKHGKGGNAGMLFRFLTAIEIWLMIYAFSPSVAGWLGLSNTAVFGGFLLAGMGILQIGLGSGRIRPIVGLLSCMSGFEIIYASLSSSVLVTGLLALVNLSLAIIGSYWMSFPNGEVRE